jgi:hypothetical protein
MSYDVTSAEHVGDYKLRLSFENGRSGVVDFAGYVRRGGAFSKLQDPTFFKAFHVNADLGTVCWGDEVDVAPETLYSEATGEPLPSWMT